MPFSDPEIHLAHMLESIAFIEEFTAGIDLAQYLVDQKTRSATERQLQILTEAAFRLGDQAQVVCPEVDWRSIQGMGNRLRHGYDQVNDDVMWNTIQFDLPTLKTAVSKSLLRLRDPRSTQL